MNSIKPDLIVDFQLNSILLSYGNENRYICSSQKQTVILKREIQAWNIR